MPDAFGAPRIQTIPPERGVFPLDHDAECKDIMKIFLDCIKSNKGDHFNCKNQSQAYLQCRMDHGLMVKDDLNHLGFGETGTYERVDPKEFTKENKGFVSGLGVAGGKWWVW